MSDLVGNPNFWFSHAQAHLFVSRMADSVDSGIKQDNISDEFLDPSCDPCKGQQKYMKVVSYCPTCVEYFCKDCNRAHANFQITKKHRLKYGSEMPACEADKPPKFQDCQIHANAVRDWFCINHNEMICSKCKDQHDRCFIRHADDMSKIIDPNDIRKFMNGASKAKDEASTVMSELEQNVSDIENRRACMLEQVKIKYEKIKAELARKFHASCEGINKTCSEHAASITAQVASLSDKVVQLDCVREDVKQETKSKLDTKLFVKMQTVVENTSEIVKSIRDLTKEINIVDLEFIEDEHWNSFLTNDTDIGFVQETMSQSSSNASLPCVSFPSCECGSFTETHFHKSRMGANPVIASMEIKRASSYTFAFITTLESNIFDIQSRMWKTKYGPRMKIPSTVLLGPDSETLVAFGYEAVDKYAEVVATRQNASYYYFEECGKDLVERFQTQSMFDKPMKDATGKCMSTMQVITHIAKYLLDDLMQQSKNRLSQSDITLSVVTPSLSTEGAKQAFIEAVKATGVPPKNIVIIPEALAVAQFCHSSIDDGRIEDIKSLIKDGDAYMIVNISGDSTEVTINKCAKPMAENMLIAHVDGIDESSIYAAFEDFLQDIVGKDVFQKFAQSWPDEVRELREDVEGSMKKLDTSAESRILFRFLGELIYTFKTMKGKELGEVLQQSRYSEDVQISGDKLYINNHIVKGFYEKPVIRTCILLQSVLQSREADKIRCIFLTGILADMREFQKAIKSAFPDIYFFFLEDGEFVAMQGAVIHAYKRRY